MKPGWPTLLAPGSPGTAKGFALQQKALYLNSVFLLAGVVAFGMGFVRWQLNPVMGAIDFAFAAINISLLLTLRRHPEQVERISTVALLLCYILFVAIYLLAPYNTTRLSLFFLLAASAFFLKGRAVGRIWLLVIVATIITIHVLMPGRTGYSHIDILTTGLYLLALFVIFENYETFKEQQQHGLREQEVLRLTEERWRQALEGAGDAVWDWDIATDALHYSPRLAEMLGYGQYGLGQTRTDLLRLAHPRDALLNTETMQAFLEDSHGQYTSQLRYRCHDGSWRWILARGKVTHRDAQGRPLRMAGTHSDITELRQAQQRMERLLAEQRAMLENDLVGIVTVRGRVILWANPAFEKMLGYGRGELVGQPTRSNYLSDDAYQALGAEAYPVLVRGGIYRTQVEHRRKDGQSIWVDLSGAILDPETGESLWAFIDITERKQIEAELEQHRQHLEQLVEQRTAALLATEARASHILQSSADGLYGIDAQGRITFINQAACAMLGYGDKQVIGQSAHELFHHSRPDGSPYPARDCPSHGALRRGQDVRIDGEVYWRADGQPVPVMYAVHPMLQDGQVTGAVVSFVDMSAQRAAAQAREMALIAAENLARVRSEFLANMSHEIRTPLNGVLGFAQIGLMKYRDSEQARNAFEKIVTSGKRLLGVINDILDFSKIEAGKLNIDQVVMDLPEVVEHAVDLVRERAAAKQLALRVTIAPDLPGRCVSDPLRIGQVLLNLLGNAVKFTGAGGITLAVSRQGEQLVFEVSDTGIGMDAAQLERLFNPFSQADGSTTRQFGGTGLGLAISKRILDLMGGEIQVHSQPGVGSRFEFRLPYVAADKATAPAASVVPDEPEELPAMAGMTILAAEDDAINQMVLADLLSETGARLVLVGNGREAVERVARDGRGAFDLVLMDVQMPEMDGYEATRRILELAPDLPIIGQTAHALEEERNRCMAAGMVGHIAKPIKAGLLAQLIRQHVRRQVDLLPGSLPG